ncbi:MAG TPA: hypothetical protein PLI45_00840 [Candidatus Woesebacteria bacterium]|nr:hypothetical protein [Candidatus Woesebacteria bacterium]
MTDIINDQVRCPIKPEDIDTSMHFFDAFGNSETEASANVLVRFCQERGKGWLPFNKDEIDVFNLKARNRSFFPFNNLLNDEFIVEQDGQFFFTIQFAARAYASSPQLN